MSPRDGQFRKLLNHYSSRTLAGTGDFGIILNSDIQSVYITFCFHCLNLIFMDLYGI